MRDENSRAPWKEDGANVPHAFSRGVENVYLDHKHLRIDVPKEDQIMVGREPFVKESGRLYITLPDDGDHPEDVKYVVVYLYDCGKPTWNPKRDEPTVVARGEYSLDEPLTAKRSVAILQMHAIGIRSESHWDRWLEDWHKLPEHKPTESAGDRNT
jgi:hypothetical protein